MIAENFKKITSFILMLGLLASSLFAQDIATVDELNASAKAILQSEGKDGVEQARGMLVLALKKSIDLNYAKGEIDVYNLMAETYELEGNPQVALRFKKKANKKSANPDAPSNVTIVKPNTIEDFATSTIPSSAKAKPKPREEEPAAPSPDQSRPSDIRKPIYQPTFSPTVAKPSGNTESDIKNKQSELEEYRKKIDELQKQAAQEGDSLSAIRNAEIARLNAERERTQSQIEALEKEKENTDLRIKQQRIVGIILINAIVIMLFFVFLVIRQIRAKNKANKELAKALDELKATQAQLVQQEKLASLGQLTAGIAHEIQNPLNFVNNFADLSLELLEELKESNDTEDMKAIANDLTQNLTKIHHHGKRADSIVKNMLQHSREQKGEKEPTDLNELLKEFVNLAYHGMRATDKNFNCRIDQSFDAALPKIKIVKQDLGRVFLNMFNNSFYSINKKIALQIDNYMPTLSISTKLDGDKVILNIRDNGLGMSEEVKQKLFNPFFTTKPTGEGTGLGLSISHDIIVKIHNGSVKVDAKEGEFASFEITLPLS
jgi:signal transduction histidine kinase